MARNELEVRLRLDGAREFERSMKQINRSVKNVGKSFNRLGSALGTFARRTGLAAAAIAGTVGTAAKQFGDFESSFNNVVTLLDDSSFATGTLEDGVKGLERGLIRLRGTSGQSFETLNKGLFDLISAGVDAAKSIETLDVASRLALAGATDTAVAVDGLTSVMNAYNREAEDATEISQLFFTAQKGGKTTIEELASGFGLVGAQAQAANVSLEEVLAAVSATTLAGIRTKQSFSGLRAAISNIQKPTGDAADEAERLGIEFSSSALRAQGLQQFLKSITESAGFNAESFERLFGSVEALNFVQALAANNAANFDSILGQLNNKTLIATNFQDALSQKQGEFNQVLNRLIGILDSVVVRLGRAFAPALALLAERAGAFVDGNGGRLEAFFERVSDVVLEIAQDLITLFGGGGPAELVNERFKSFVTGAQAFADAVKGAFATIQPIWEGFVDVLDVVAGLLGVGSGGELGMILILGQLSGLFGVVTASAGALLAIFRLFATLALNPLFLGIAAALLIVASGFSDSEDSADSFLQKILKLIGVTDEGILGMAAKWDSFFSGLRTGASALTGFLGELFAGLFALLTGDFETFNNLTFEKIKAFNAGMREFVIGVIQGFNDLVGGAVEAVAGLIKDAFVGIKDFILGIFKSIGSAISSAISKVKQLITGSKQAAQAGSAGFATGGPVSGPGTGSSDSIPARLSNGEFVMRASAVKKFGSDFFGRLNRGIMPLVNGFAEGGLVGDALASSLPSFSAPSLATASPAATTSGRPLTLVLPGGETIKATTSEDTAQRLQKTLRRGNTAQTGGLPSWY